MDKTAAIVLAAGQGTRMQSKLVKVLHPLAGLEMIGHVVRNVRSAAFKRVVVVVGYQGEKVEAVLKDVVTVKQEQQLGTGHAVNQCRQALAGYEGPVLVTYGDTPLFRAESFQRLLAYHKKTKASATVLTALVTDPKGYGRILRDKEGNVVGIVEEKDASEEEQKIKEINTGTYCFQSGLLFEYLAQLTPDNVQGEYYLPDVVPLFISGGQKVAGCVLEDAQESMGVNDRIQLAEAESILRDRIAHSWMKRGVTLIDPKTTWIESDCIIGKDTTIYPQTYLQKGSVVGSNCRIGPNCRLEAARIGDGVVMENTVVLGKSVKAGSKIMPFTFLTK
ncbi:MAG: NTP transferase domain-containing protein [Firmicutes bacterium]|nr:NTP transferase domain-containing protein [Bacillota bacterium]